MLKITYIYIYNKNNFNIFLNNNNFLKSPRNAVSTTEEIKAARKEAALVVEKW